MRSVFTLSAVMLLLHVQFRNWIVICGALVLSTCGSSARSAPGESVIWQSLLSSAAAVLAHSSSHCQSSLNWPARPIVLRSTAEPRIADAGVSDQSTRTHSQAHQPGHQLANANANLIIGSQSIDWATAPLLHHAHCSLWSVHHFAKDSHWKRPILFSLAIHRHFRWTHVHSKLPQRGSLCVCLLALSRIHKELRQNGKRKRTNQTSDCTNYEVSSPTMAAWLCATVTWSPEWWLKMVVSSL